MTGSPTKRQRRQRFAQFTADPDRAMQAIVEHVGKGRGLTSFAQGVDLPLSSLHDWVRAQPERALMYDRARQRGAAALAEESLNVLDTAERGGDGLPTSATVAIVKAKSDTLKWLAARLSPADWGDSLAISSTIAVSFDIRALLARREERLMQLEGSIHSGQNAELCARDAIAVLPTHEEHHERTD